MKKRKNIFILLACVIVMAAIIFAFSGRRPFKSLQPSDIVSASVRLTPPDETVQITDIPELVEYLQKVVIYNKDNSYHDYCGQGAIFTLSLSDGSQVSVMEFNPFLVIDGVGYKTKYAPCYALSRYAINLLSAAG